MHTAAASSTLFGWALGEREARLCVLLPSGRRERGEDPGNCPPSLPTGRCPPAGCSPTNKLGSGVREVQQEGGHSGLPESRLPHLLPPLSSGALGQSVLKSRLHKWDTRPRPARGSFPEAPATLTLLRGSQEARCGSGCLSVPGAVLKAQGLSPPSLRLWCEHRVPAQRPRRGFPPQPGGLACHPGQPARFLPSGLLQPGLTPPLSPDGFLLGSLLSPRGYRPPRSGASDLT